MISGGRHSTVNLPAELVKTSRVVFDQLSPSGSPIHYHQFAIRWPEYQRRDSGRFPVTFLDCLRRVTPHNGMLTFERFCAGLRLAVAEERENNMNASNQQQQQQKRSRAVYGRGQGQVVEPTPPLPPTRGSESIEKTKELMKTVYGSSQSMTAGQPKMNQPRPPPYNVALSRSKLNLQSIDQPPQSNRTAAINDLNKMTRSTPQLCGDKRPSLMANGVATAAAHNNVIAGLRNGGHQVISSGSSRPSSAQSTDTNGSLEGIRFRDKSSSINAGGAAANGLGQRARNDSRRHTVMEGNENSSSNSRHLLLMQEEKGLLKKGGDTASRLHNWYNDRLSSLETREKLLGKSMIPVDVAVHEERLNYLRAHITEVNRRAVALMESSEKGFPWHMNLELNRNIPQPADDQLMWLKRQNKMLTDEVSEKCERITQLEREKAQLLEHCRHPSTVGGPNGGGVPQHSSNYSNNNGPFGHNNGWSSSSGGADSGFHSLSNHHSPPYHPGLVVVNGDKHRRPPTITTNGASSNAVYAAPIVAAKNEKRFNNESAVAPPHSKRVYAELHNPPPPLHTDSPRNGVLATLM